jgi:hypothetical protein
MNLFELHSTLTITERKINEIPLIKAKIESQLNALKARTYISENVIDFKTISMLAFSGYTETNPILLRFYKEGNIVIDKQKESLKFVWTVKLDSLYAIALSFAFISLIFSSFAIEFIFSIIVGITVFLLVVFVGVIFILSSMNDLILSSVYEK